MYSRELAHLSAQAVLSPQFRRAMMGINYITSIVIQPPRVGGTQAQEKGPDGFGAFFAGHALDCSASPWAGKGRRGMLLCTLFAHAGVSPASRPPTGTAQAFRKEENKRIHGTHARRQGL